MELLSKDITLGFYNEMGILSIPISQYDVNRIIVISFTNDGKRFHIPDDTSVYLKAIKPDGTQINTDDYCEIKDGKAAIRVFKQLSAVSGVVRCEMILSDADGKQYTTSHFNIVVNPSVHNDEHLISSDEYKNIIEILLEIESLRENFLFKADKDIANGIPSLDENVKIPRDELYDADLKSKGVVKLVDSVESYSVTDAATPNSVKTVNDILEEHKDNQNNPHNVTKSHVGLENVDNTSDINKPVSTAQQNAIDSAMSDHNTSIYAHEDMRDLITTLTSSLANISYDDLSNKPDVVSKTANGFVPQLPDDENTTKYLRQDGIWAVPSGTNENSDTWKPNTKDQEGYVSAGNGNVNMVWGTDEFGNPGWISIPDIKEDVTDLKTKFESFKAAKSKIVSSALGGLLALTSSSTIAAVANEIDEYIPIIKWTNTVNGTYKFEQNGDRWIANNRNINSSTATSTWTVTVPSATTAYIGYRTASEANYDKLSITLNGSNILSNISGLMLNESEIILNLVPGKNTLIATYTKDSSNSSYGDMAYVILPPIGENSGQYKYQSKSIAPSTSLQTIRPDTGYDGLSEVSVSTIKLQSKSITPSTSTQTITPDNNFDGLYAVTVAGMPSTWQTKTGTFTFGAANTTQNITIGFVPDILYISAIYNNKPYIIIYNNSISGYTNNAIEAGVASGAAGTRTIGSNCIINNIHNDGTVTTKTTYAGFTNSQATWYAIKF